MSFSFFLILKLVGGNADSSIRDLVTRALVNFIGKNTLLNGAYLFILYVAFLPKFVVRLVFD